MEVLRRRAAEATALVAMNHYYADFMATLLAVSKTRVHVVPPGLNLAGHGTRAGRQSPIRIGYLARICPEKGLKTLAGALRRLADDPSVPPVHVRAAGYLDPADRPYLLEIEREIAAYGLADRFQYAGELDRPQKITFLQACDVFTLPTTHPEAKGLSVFEAWANAVPAVLPAHGAFPEMVADTGGGVLYSPADPAGLAAALKQNDLGPGPCRGLRPPGSTNSPRTLQYGEDGAADDRSVSAIRDRVTGLRSALWCRRPACIVPRRRDACTTSRGKGPQRTRRRVPPAFPMSQLQVEHVAKQFATRAEPLVVLRDVSFMLSRGENMAILGPSGSGKSTLLSIVGTLEPPSSGRVVVDGQDPATLNEPALAEFRNRRIGFVFQDHHLLPQCSVLENVLVPMVAAGPIKAEAVDRARMLLDRVGLTARLDHRPAELSGGERQRVALARSLIHAPLVLLADEPTGNLDRTTAERVGRLLLELQQQEQTILIVATHSPRLAAMMSRRLELDDGLLKEE